MRNNGKGGMQTSGVEGSLWCPKCGHLSARKDTDGVNDKYMHFTKKGCVWHSVKRVAAQEGNK